MNQYISIGKIARPHGFKGSFITYTDLGKESALSYLKRIFVGREIQNLIECQLTESAWMPKGWKVTVDKFQSDTEIKSMQGWDVFADRADLKEKASFEYYVSDLIGMKTVDENGTTLGTFHSMSEIGTKDGKISQQSWNFVKPSGEEFSIPAIKRFIKSVDLKNKTITLQNMSDFE